MLDNFGEFIPQAHSNTAGACTTANEYNEYDGDGDEWMEFYDVEEKSQPKLFEKVADDVITKQDESNSQVIANCLWAYATNGQIDRNFFKSLAPTASALVGKCTSQNLANIAWAYAVANVAAPSIFNDDFIDACLKKKDDFTLEELSQLHQWHIWQEGLKSNIRLPQSLQKKCHDAFVSTAPRPSAL